SGRPRWRWPASRRRAAIRFSRESGETPSARSMPRRASVVKPPSGDELVLRPLPQHDPNEIGRVPGAELVHDAGAMHLDGAWGDAERAASLLVGGAGDDPGQHLALARRERL